jgi:26S proteasome non-ATPase regulatory subunit 10
MTAKDNAGQTALHFAASKNNLDIARKLIAQKATTRTKDKRQQLPLLRAAAVGSIPMMKLFLDNRSPINATDIDNMTALHHAVSEGHGDAAVFLLKAGAEHDKRDGNGNLAIQLAPDVKVCSESKIIWRMEVRLMRWNKDQNIHPPKRRARGY